VPFFVSSPLPTKRHVVVVGLRLNTSTVYRLGAASVFFSRHLHACLQESLLTAPASFILHPTPSTQHPLPHKIRLLLPHLHPPKHSFASFHITHPEYQYQYHHQLTHPHIHTLISRQSVTKGHLRGHIIVGQEIRDSRFSLSSRAEVRRNGSYRFLSLLAQPCCTITPK
jgi:hypothetical protein